ncbi:hypothetical protein MRX96_043143 [Rhipicephalus microplus]
MSAPSPSPPSATASYTHERVETPSCVPCYIQCKEDHVTGSRPCKLRFNRTGPSPSSHSKLQPSTPAPHTGPILKSFRPSRLHYQSTSRSAQSSSHHRSFPPLPRTEASAPAATQTTPVRPHHW